MDYSPLLIVAPMLTAHAALIVSTHKVIRVVDGDTFIIRRAVGFLGLGREEQTIRIFGIDAPELKQPGGMRAKAELEKLILGKRVWITKVNKDAYGRAVCKVRVGFVDVAAVMVSRGWAHDDDVYSKGLYKPQEKQAQGWWIFRKGIWKNRRVQKPKLFRNGRQRR